MHDISKLILVLTSLALLATAIDVIWATIQHYIGKRREKKHDSENRVPE